MKKFIIALVAGAAIVSTTSCTGGKAKLTTQNDSLSYALGMHFGGMMKQSFGADAKNIDQKILLKAINDVINTDTLTVINQQQAQEVFRNYFEVILPAKNKEESKSFVEKAKTENKDAKESASGLVYKIENAGNASVVATDADTVVVKYVGTMPDGKEFDKSESASIPVAAVVPGFKEGLKLIGEGGKITLWLPSDLAYGVQGQPYAGIPANKALKFEVTIDKVIKGGVSADTTSLVIK